MKIFLIFCALSLFGTEKEFFFEGLSHSPLEPLSIFAAPTEFLHIHFNESSPFEGLAPDQLSSCKAIYLEAFVFPPFIGSRSFQKVKDFLVGKDFIPFSLWYREGVQAGMLFFKRSCFYNPLVASYLHSHSIDERYHPYQQRYWGDWPHFPICYWIDNDEEDSVKQVLMTGHAYEGNISLMAQALAKPKTIAIDIGAHIGVHTVFMSRKVGKEGAVLSFEPNQKLYMEHLHHLTVHQCQNVIPICKGLGDEEKKETLCRITIEQNDLLKGEKDEIEIVPLDSYFLNNVSLIKMDVENYEYFVLKGAKNTILRNKPPILFECWIGYEYEKKDASLQRENFDRVMALLDSYGYDIYIIYNCDFLAIPRDAKDEIVLSYKQKLKRLEDPASYQGEPLEETE